MLDPCNQSLAFYSVLTFTSHYILLDDSRLFPAHYL